MESITNLLQLNRSEIINGRKRRHPKRNTNLTVEAMSLFIEVEFNERYRMKKSTMRRIIELVRPKLDWSTERNYIKSVNIQVLTAIRVFRSGSFQQINVDIYSLSQLTVSRIISKVAEAFAGEFKNFIEFPSNDQLDLIKYGFYKIAKFHNVVGLIDCTHVPHHCPWI